MNEIISTSPLDETELGRIKIATKDEISRAVENARSAFPSWSAKPIEERVELLKKLKPLVKERAKEIARVVHKEMGKPEWSALGEAESVMESIEFHCSNDPEYLKPISLSKAGGKENTQLFEPLGVIAVITPWNFPFSIPFDGALPALISGSTVVLKPSEQTTLVGLEVKKIFDELEKQGLPKHVFNFVAGGKKEGKFLVQQNVDMVSFVGSRRAGVEIMRDSADQLHRLILELGGKDPAIVCGDADLEKTAHGIVQGAMRNCGQVCCSIERVYVVEPVYEKFVELAKKETSSIKFGADENATIGPLIGEFQRKIVREHLEDAVKKGARILAGGRQPEKKGFWFEPTLVVDVSHKMKLMTEETFGPVLPVMKVKDVDEAVALSNESIYGLTASIWTEDRKKGKEIARRLVAGTVSINRRGGVKEGCPWGGAKQSGIGRQSGPDSVRGYTEIKHLWVE